MGLFGSSKGRRCEPLSDGTGLQCKIYKNQDNEKRATGTDITITASPENGCEPVLIGTSDISDDDEKEVQKIAAQVAKVCKKGFA